MSALRRLNAPTIVGLVCAIALFIAFLAGWLASWTPLEGTYARDYITLPKCGLAARFGTNMFTSSEDYMWFGPVGNGWLSHPALCVTAGIPTSYLPWEFGFKLLDVLYLVLHLGTIAAFGSRLKAPYRIRDFVVFVAIGLFFPWYVMYHVGQYHAISVLALTLVLLGPRRRVLGFVVSAVTKPILAPAGLVMITRGRFREAIRIGLWVAAISLPFILLGYTKETGFHWGGDAFDQYIQIGRDQAKLFVPHWDQQISLAMLIDEWFPAWNNLNVRVGLTVVLIAVAVLGLRRAPMEVAIAMTSLWFFTYYARGHEYHATVLVPVYAYLWTESRGRYRNPWVALLCVSSALPTTWPIFIHSLDLAGPGPDSFAFMEDKSPLLFNLFLGQKPLTALLLAGTIAFTELRPRRAESEAPASAPAPSAEPVQVSPAV